MYCKCNSYSARPFYSFVSLMLSTKKRAELEDSSFLCGKVGVIVMNQVIQIILTILFTLGVGLFAFITILLNNIDEVIEWVNKKAEKED